ncbi:MAG: type I restriction enzyme HsdR N-terminal domain-containing protein [Chloroflexota bacterium]
MKQLNLPEYTFRIAGNEGSETIFDQIRRKFVRLTPEEWVRQNFIRYLVTEGKYPPGLMGVEVMFMLNRLKRRVDILVHDRLGKPVMIVECKEPEVKIDDKVFDQIVTYNIGLKVPYIVVTNGLVHYACKVRKDQPGYEFINVIPLYEELNTEPA